MNRVTRQMALAVLGIAFCTLAQASVKYVWQGECVSRQFLGSPPAVPALVLPCVDITMVITFADRYDGGAFQWFLDRTLVESIDYFSDDDVLGSDTGFYLRQNRPGGDLAAGVFATSRDSVGISIRPDGFRLISEQSRPDWEFVCPPFCRLYEGYEIRGRSLGFRLLPEPQPWLLLLIAFALMKALPMWRSSSAVNTITQSHS